MRLLNKLGKGAAILGLVAGCANPTAYLAARHESDPRAEHDGWDFACGGYKTRGQVNFKLGYCRELRQGDDLVEVEVEVELWREK